MLGVVAKVAIVTGGSRGIGAAVAEAFAGAGWDVALGYRNEERAARAVVERVEALGRSAVAVRLDVADEPEVVGLFELVRASLGAPSAVVNNAGMVATESRLDEMSAERIERMLAVNVLGAFLCAREAVRSMSARHGGAGGAIVNVSSGATKVGSPAEYVDYAASKGALEVFTVGLAKEVGGEGIRVNAVRPGVIDTEIHARNEQADKPARLASSVPLGRAGGAGEVAAAIYWLCTDAASYVNGAILDVTGGR
jgi:NAD(P)-dependent dehydrogenase (short-subunit alcohol dehydrogenase family)